MHSSGLNAQAPSLPHPPGALDPAQIASHLAGQGMGSGQRPRGGGRPAAVPKLFNVQSNTIHGHGLPVSVDMFGAITTPRTLPDERPEKWLPPTSGRKQPRRKSKKEREREQWRSATPRSGFSTPRPLSANVVLLPELRDLSTPRAVSLSLEAAPGLIRSYVAPSVSGLHGGEGSWPEEAPAVCKDRPEKSVRELRNSVPSDEGIRDILRKSTKHVILTPQGMIPPDTARHDDRHRADKIYTVRQNFPLRATSRDLQEGSQTDRTHGRGRETGDRGGDGVSRERSSEPRPPPGPPKPQPPPPPGDGTGPRAIRRRITQKLFNCKHVADGKGGYVVREKPAKIPVALPPTSVEEGGIDWVKENTKMQTAQGNKLREESMYQGFELRDLRAEEVKRRREELEEERRRWQEGVYERAKRRLSVDAKKEMEEQAEARKAHTTWLGALAQARWVLWAQEAVKAGRRERVRRRTLERCARKLQKWVRGIMVAKVLTTDASRREDALVVLRRGLTPSVLRWKMRRKTAKADVLQTFLTELAKNNAVKQRLSLFLFQMRRLQRVWRNYLRRERARMVLLSKQWDKAFLLIRTGGKYGRIGKTMHA
eukprot:CAMPEP_0114128950 /NCGR_PEP_ID=MMETSP0043_2-20121206/11213_1 /TAXON_ID=464988 /ORGANISM="Hemiselmis andersenii, Strain CCMP644" /LENGTH=596 /DNA_ID=CAMNT_0001222189 /DNA_START=12 /DNA_END=1799 /DNA_ORIENTATION=+